MPMVNTRGKLTSHTKILEDHQRHSLEQRGSGQYDDTYNLDPNFVVDILTKKDYKVVEPINHNINFHKEGSKLDDNRTGAGLSTTDILTLLKKWEERRPTLYC